MRRAARSRKYALSPGGRYGFSALLFAVASAVVTSESVTKPCVHIRGGSKEEDVALDAFIDELIASVNDVNKSTALGDETFERSSSHDSMVIVASTRPRKRRRPKKKKKQVEAQLDDFLDTSGNEEVMKGHQSSAANEEDEDLVPHTNHNHSISTKDKQEGEQSEQEEEDIEESSEVVQVELQEQGNIQQTDSDSETDKEVLPQEIVRRYPPPNALYRFLLDLGIVGQTLALLLMFITDYLNAYVPFLSSLVWYFLPQSQLNDRTRPERRALSQFASSAVSSRRTGQSSRQRRKLTKQADQIALDQLKRVGNVQEAKYRYVSLEFLTRHGVGLHTTTQAENSTTDEVANQESSGVITTKKEEGDWVLNALTKDLSPKRGDSKSKTPRIIFEFDFQKRTQVAKAALTPKNKKKSASPKVSDRDGFLGRIRAAAGANSKSLLGAYPGDAVSLGEAADPRGVYDLARRYGWGEWEDEEDVAPSFSLSHSRVKKRRRKDSDLNEREDIPPSPIDVDRSKDRFHQPAIRKSKKKSHFYSDKREKDSAETHLRNNVAHRTRRITPRDPLARLVQAQGEKKDDER
ncbi:hypothetical protein FisN_22Lh116 [Fistulifera solaris]|uniref:Uncharacterized protein n=1 Tax=Fistulifera solaris TaxID=1519565 RepID=A0A1Z5JCE1_FISSO|nr:hypothetical protein FisN_22Lh116 [Fistulifera solaris]|eukprot:GAX11431.1 hypothetical protein FisN_22Lh116 [Fistulifera solaris]